MPAYQTGTADAGLDADAGVARSLIPPGTAAVRDFSSLSPRIPQFIAEKCVGCMACVIDLPRQRHLRHGPAGRGSQRRHRQLRRRPTSRPAPSPPS